MITPMAHYDIIANQWHQTTGYQGGTSKKFILNDFLLGQIGSIHDKAILGGGAGNGYFIAWLVERFFCRSQAGHGRDPPRFEHGWRADIIRYIP